MHLARLLGTTALIIAAAAFPVEAQEPLTDPIWEPIPKGDLIVAATRFVRAPQTEDPSCVASRPRPMPASST